MIYQGDNFSLDTQSYVLRRDGEPHPVEPQVFDLLLYLIEHRDRVVTRDELLDNLWPGRIVSESALNGRLKIARKAIGDDGRQQKLIKTIHRRGYQFIAGVRTDANSAETSPGARSDIEAADDKPSVAVMPFRLVGQVDDVDYLAGGLTDVVITALCRYRELLVIAHDSVYACLERGFDLDRAAAELGARYLVSGQVQRSGNRVRVSIRLINAATGETMWAEQIDRSCDDVLSLEDEVASRIASSLVSHVEAESIRRAERKRPENMTVYDYLVRARSGVDSFEEEPTQQARQLLEQAVALDPNYAPAHALLAWSWCAEAESAWGLPRGEAIDCAERYARQAVALDDYDSDAHVVLGWVYRLQSKFDLAELHNKRAIECNPNDYDAFCAQTWLLAICGRADEAMTCVETSLRLNPLAPDDCLLAIMLTEYLAERYENALETSRRIQVPNLDNEALRAACLAQLGRDDEARRAARSALELGGDFVRRGWAEDGWNFKRRQDREHLLSGFYKAGVLIDPAQVSGKPSLAVLNFANISNDPEQAYFAQGMTFNVCSRLARIKSFQVKSGRECDPGNAALTEIARDLEVRYLVRGAVQREADHVRVFVELIEGESGDIRWSEHFDRRGRGVIDIQDDIAAAIAATLGGGKGTIREAERNRLAKKMTSDFNAFDYILQGMSYKEQYRAEALPKAHECFDKAIELDPGSAEAYSWKAWVYILERFLGGVADSDESIKQAVASAKKAIALDAGSDGGHWALAEAYFELGESARGFSELEIALDINPNNPDLMVTKGLELSIAGQHDEGIEWIHRAINFNRHFPEWYFWHLGIALFAGHRWQEAIGAFMRMDEQNRDTLTYLVASCVLVDDAAAASKWLAELLRLDPGLDLDEIAKTHASLGGDTVQRMVDSIGLLMADEGSRETLRIVKN